MIHLYAHYKNDYFFHTPLSDLEGRIAITKEWLTQEIWKTRSLFIMDYASNLSDCKPVVSLQVLDEKGVENMVEGMHFWQNALKTSDEEIEHYRNACNREYLEGTFDFSIGPEDMDILLNVQPL